MRPRRRAGKRCARAAGGRIASGPRSCRWRPQDPLARAARSGDGIPGRCGGRSRSFWRTNHGDQGQRDFGRHERAAQALRTGAFIAASAALLQHVVQAYTRGLEGGRQPGRDARRDTYHHGERQKIRVQRNGKRNGQVCAARHQIPDRLAHPHGERHANHYRQCSHNQGFVKQMARQPRAARPDGRARRTLSVAPSRERAAG